MTEYTVRARPRKGGDWAVIGRCATARQAGRLCEAARQRPGWTAEVVAPTPAPAPAAKSAAPQGDAYDWFAARVKWAFPTTGNLIPLKTDPSQLREERIPIILRIVYARCKRTGQVWRYVGVVRRNDVGRRKAYWTDSRRFSGGPIAKDGSETQRRGPSLTGKQFAALMLRMFGPMGCDIVMAQASAPPMKRAEFDMLLPSWARASQAEWDAELKAKRGA